MVAPVFVTRFAPSSTGGLHLGHALSALLAFDAAQAVGGRFVLRIEDIDTVRCRPEHVTGILEDLAWLGLSWEEPVRHQSRHLTDYAPVLERLIAAGLVRACTRSRREVVEAAARAPQAGDPVDTPDAAEGQPVAWRLDLEALERWLAGRALSFVETGAGPDGQAGRIPVSAGEIAAKLGQVILGRKDAGTSYHLACTHDDALQGVSHVIRGRDLYDCTGLHVVIQTLMGWPTPTYHHHRLLLGPDGKRLAKRDRAETLAALRAQGVSAAEVRHRVGAAGGRRLGALAGVARLPKDFDAPLSDEVLAQFEQ